MSPAARAVLLLTLCSGCASGPDRPATATARPAPDRAVAVVFSADGAGGLGETTDTLAQVIAQDRLPLRVERVEWSHGEGRFLLDHLDQRNLKLKGEALGPGGRADASRAPPEAASVSLGRAPAPRCCSRPPRPCPPIAWTGWCCWPPRCRPATTSGRPFEPRARGSTLLYSERDWFVLGLGMAFSGTTDGSSRQSRAASASATPPRTPAMRPFTPAFGSTPGVPRRSRPDARAATTGPWKMSTCGPASCRCSPQPACRPGPIGGPPSARRRIGKPSAGSEKCGSR